MNYTIISKLPTAFNYTKWRPSNGMFVPEYQILINGGAGVAGGAELLSGRPLDKRSLFTPQGVATEVTEDVLNKLRAIKKFQQHEERGLIIVMKGHNPGQDRVDDIAQSDGEDADRIQGRPLTEKDLERVGATINDDGSVDISKAKAMSPLEARTREAGLPFYQKSEYKNKQKSECNNKAAKRGRKGKGK